MSINRRQILQSALAVGAIATLGKAQAQEYANPANSEPTPVGDDSWKTGTKLVLLGTQGGPIMNVERMMTSQAVVVNGKVHLVDFGYGTLRRMAEMQIPVDALKNLYLTHHHSDHMMDLPAIMNVTWASGVKGPIGVYAPKPIDQTLKAAVDVFSEDYRIRGAGGRFKPVEQLFIPHAVSKNNKINTPAVIYQDSDVKVTGIKVPHSEFDLALGLRFDTKDRSIALSGDTAYSDHVVALAKGADMLVHEAMYWEGIIDMLKARGNGTVPKSQEEYFTHEHTKAEDAGRIAQAAGVKTLVLNHLISGPGAVTDEQWIATARKHFNGNIIVARDRMII